MEKIDKPLDGVSNMVTKSFELPLIAIGLMTAYKPETWPISVYMIALALITIVSVYFATETRQRAQA